MSSGFSFIRLRFLQIEKQYISLSIVRTDYEIRYETRIERLLTSFFFNLEKNTMVFLMHSV